MKRAIICAICEKPKRESDTYAVKLTDYRLGSLVGLQTEKPVFQKVRVCRVCVKRMGYKIKKNATRVAVIKPVEGQS